MQVTKTQPSAEAVVLDTWTTGVVTSALKTGLVFGVTDGFITGTDGGVTDELTTGADGVVTSDITTDADGGVTSQPVASTTGGLATASVVTPGDVTEVVVVSGFCLFGLFFFFFSYIDLTLASSEETVLHTATYETSVNVITEQPIEGINEHKFQVGVILLCYI